MSRKETELMRDIKRRWANQCEKGELFCFLCGKQLKPGDKYNADHWLPRALGGTTTEDNLKPACVICNSRKGCIHPREFELHREEILSGKYDPKHPKEKPIILKNKPQKKKKITDLGNTIYYIQQVSTKFSSKIIIKRGVIIGYAGEDCVLVKDFYVNEYNIMESQLIAVVPFSKKEALQIKLQYDNQLTGILQKQLQNSR